MEPFRKLYEEISEQFEGSWVDDEFWRLRGLPDSRLWLRLDVASYEEWPKGDAEWGRSRIDLRAGDGSRYGSYLVESLSGFKTAGEAAVQVRESIEEWLEAHPS
jgi:hypothetical protein